MYAVCWEWAVACELPEPHPNVVWVVLLAWPQNMRTVKQHGWSQSTAYLRALVLFSYCWYSVQDFAEWLLMLAWTNSGIDHVAASLGDAFFRSLSLQRVVNVVQIRYVKPPKCFKLGRGVFMCEVCMSVLPVLLLGHTLNDHNSLPGSVCSATAVFSFHRFSVAFIEF